MAIRISRRELVALMAASPALKAFSQTPKRAPVAIALCPSYSPVEVSSCLATMFDQVGGLPKLVANKTVTIKLNLTGSPSARFQDKPLGETHYVNPQLAYGLVSLLNAAGARRIRLVESCYASNGPLEAYLVKAGWSISALQAASNKVEFENTNALGSGDRYHRFSVPGGGLIYPGYDLNHAYRDTDVFVSLAKLKNHATCGVTLSMKNIFGITPASIYGDDAGVDEPNESPKSSRVACCHEGKRQPSSCSPAELNPSSSREPGHRMPRITAELSVARPIHLSVIDGIQTVAGGEGPWIRGLRAVSPGVLIAGTNPVSTDAVATAVMGYNPRAKRGEAPFHNCDNTLLLAESLGVGSADLSQIDVRGVPVSKAVYQFG